MRLRVRVDEEMCMGAGNCLHLAEGVFELNDEGIAEVVDENAADEEALRMAARSCPTSAIILEEQPDG